MPLNFALPDNKTPGSGLTIIVGPNNSGKTTIIESIQAFNGYETGYRYRILAIASSVKKHVEFRSLFQRKSISNHNK